MPERFLIDDSMILAPAPPEQAAEVEIVRGPNIGEPPRNAPLPERLDGVVPIKVGDKITTDHIMPAGARLKYRSNVRQYAEFVFEGVDPTSPRGRRRSATRQAQHHRGGSSYGQGSSREHAALCPMYLGVKAVVAKTIERIHMANLINFGIVPLVFESDADYDRIDQGDAWRWTTSGRSSRQAAP